MRAVVLAILLLTSAVVLSDETAYILIDAVSFPKSFKQPTWIALHRLGSGRRVIHIRVGRGIAKVEPGRYEIAHIDFQQSTSSDAGTIDIPTSDRDSFNVTLDEILLVGLVEIHPKGISGDQFRLTVSVSQELLSSACRSEPEVMKRLPVRILTKDKEAKLVRISCET